MPQKPLPLSEQIRQAIDASGVSRYRIGKEIDVSESSLSHFMAGRAGLSQAALDRLGMFLGLEIVAKVKGEKVKHGKRKQ
jgi:ribosome-binding protein aMBF1 (putative translation factor)